MASRNRQFDLTELPKHKVELHVHLDGSVRISTLWSLSEERGIILDARNVDELSSLCYTKTPTNLANFLKPFELFLPVIVGDREILERVAYEFVEDAAKEGILYVETRYSPHLLSSTHGATAGHPVTTVTPKDVVESVNKGLTRGSSQFGVHVRSILCCIRGRSEWSDEVLRLCTEFRNDGVVGMDICGDQEAHQDTTSYDVEIFKRAASLGIHRTAHAGEDGPASQVRMSIRELRAERIGHGYHVVDDPSIYEECLEAGTHFEACPLSSFLTGSVSPLCSKHPIVRFAEDGANFSISRDDPTLIQKSLEDDYELLRGLGLRDVHFARANFNAVRSCFLPPGEKNILLQELRTVYGMTEETNINI